MSTSVAVRMVTRTLVLLCITLLIVNSSNPAEAKKIRREDMEENEKDQIAGNCLLFGGKILGEKCLYFSGIQETFNWTDADILCSRKFGELARFDEYPWYYLDVIELREQEIGGLLPSFWVGGHDPSHEGDWEWDNGVPIPLNNREFPWGPNQPSSQGVDNCLDIATVDGSDIYKYGANLCSQPLQYICEIGCSFNGVIYPPGAFIHNVCILLQCNGITGGFINHGYDEHCPNCTLWGDPHIKPYDWPWPEYVSYDPGNCSISYLGSINDPSIAVYGEFVLCAPNLYCVHDVTFKNDKDTVLTCSFDFSNYEIKLNVNGNDVNGITPSPSVIEVDGTHYPILAWTSTYKSPMGIQQCLSLQGSSGLTVQFCGDTSNWHANSVNIWAIPEILHELNGFCGNGNGNVQEYCVPMAGQRRKRDSENFTSYCERNTSLSNIFQNQCEDAILNGVHTAHKNIEQNLIDACVFDMCHVNDPEEWMVTVHAAMPKHHEIREKTVGHCLHKRTHSCKTHNGTCILKTEICEGTIIEKGCHGQKCICCASNPCEQDPECGVKKQGKCIPRKDWGSCNDILDSELCSGNDCACCYPKAAGISHHEENKQPKINVEVKLKF